MVSRSEKYIDEIIALIRGGMTCDAACKSNPDFPTRRSLSEWAAKHGRSDDITAAWRERERNPATATMKTNVKYTEAQWDAAIELLSRNPRKSIRKASKELGLNLPPRESIYKRKRSDKAFEARWLAAVGRLTTVKARHNGPTKPKSPTKDGLLALALRAHPLWIAARRAVPRSEYDEDVIQEIVLAVLVGELEASDIKSKGNTLGYKRLGRHVFTSLDEPMRIGRERDRGTLIDTIATDNEIVFY